MRSQCEPGGARDRARRSQGDIGGARRSQGNPGRSWKSQLATCYHAINWYNAILRQPQPRLPSKLLITSFSIPLAKVWMLFGQTSR